MVDCVGPLGLKRKMKWIGFELLGPRPQAVLRRRFAAGGGQSPPYGYGTRSVRTTYCYLGEDVFDDFDVVGGADEAFV